MATYQQREFWKAQLPKLTATERLIAYQLLEMALEAVRQGLPFTPRNAVIAVICKCSVRTVQRATAKLSFAGCLDKIARYVVQNGIARRVANRLRIILPPHQRVFRVLNTIRPKLMGDRGVTPKTTGVYSDRFIPSETYKRLMREGVERWRS